MYLVKKNKSNEFIPAYPADEEQANKVAVGDELKATRARNPKFHRLFMSLLKLGFENQDKHKEFEHYRKQTIINAGYFFELVDKAGNVHKQAESISFENMNQETFEQLYSATIDVVSKETQTSKKNIEDELINYL